MTSGHRITLGKSVTIKDAAKEAAKWIKKGKTK
jgi:hypothetical protein